MITPHWWRCHQLPRMCHKTVIVLTWNRQSFTMSKMLVWQPRDYINNLPIYILAPLLEVSMTSPALALDELSDVDESWFEEIQNRLKRRYLPDSPAALPSPKVHSSNPRVPSPSTSCPTEPSQYSSQELILPPWPASSSHAAPTIEPEF